LKTVRITKKLIKEIAKEQFKKSNIDKLNDPEKHAIAIELLRLGCVYEFSSFESQQTYGYGKIDNYGFFEYPLYEKDVNPKRILLKRRKEKSHVG